jgi:peptide/nickel transport system permease protein
MTAEHQNQEPLEAPELASDEKHRSLWGDVWRQFRRHKGAIVGLAVLTIIMFFSFIVPFIWPHEPFTINVPEANQGPTWSHPFGTDTLGRDVFIRTMVGGRISLSVGITAALLGISIGTVVGILAGFFKWLDGLLMRLTDLFLSLPVLPLLLVLSMLYRETLRDAFGPEMGIFLLVVFIIGITSWMQTARVVRGEVLAIKRQEFVLAAHSIGTRRSNVILRHIFPNVLSPVMVAAALGVAVAIITESALSFLGLGFPSDFPTWGRLLFDAQSFIELAPMRVIWPGALISLTVISVNFIGDGLRDALDPKLRSR